MGFNCLKVTEPLQRDSLIFTAQSPEVPGAHLINFSRLKDWNNLDLEVTLQNWIQDLDWESSTLITRIIGKTIVIVQFI